MKPEIKIAFDTYTSAICYKFSKFMQILDVNNYSSIYTGQSEDSILASARMLFEGSLHTHWGSILLFPV